MRVVSQETVLVGILGSAYSVTGPVDTHVARAVPRSKAISSVLVLKKRMSPG